MVISSEVVLNQLVIHKIADEGLITSPGKIESLDEDLNQLLVKYFFKSFKEEERYHFDLENEEHDHQVYQIVNQIFEQPDSLFDQSVEMATLLARLSQNQNIKEGDFLVCHFEDCVMDDEVTEVIGMFKVENKETYIKILGQGNDFNIISDEGISINKLDKGVLIFNTDKENGYQVLHVDITNKSNSAQYWQKDFLGIEKTRDDYFQTQNLINNLQEFAQGTFQHDEKPEKLAFVNQSIDYLKQNPFFNKQDFGEKVLQSPELIDQFENFQERKQEENPDLYVDQFDISKPAIKNTKRFIRSIIKLDKNFHIYVHGNKDQIIRGFDPDKKLNYYTLYFSEES
ncbi:nucleoid-associated protein [Reichenbachiella agarivorans]|uniref:Nucleoid-associated protein n=1 Tax=Reichenbachiella agarivorans TaxID=2979464 RepID=A0ABY6CJ54_9BACT|nr:nucleoid-associated protein [Reichenbachiella agarivorans]UXP30557.1 nucleoid-associated protein [Reichenbachiella agarivorans]